MNDNQLPLDYACAPVRKRIAFRILMGVLVLISIGLLLFMGFVYLMLRENEARVYDR